MQNKIKNILIWIIIIFLGVMVPSIIYKYFIYISVLTPSVQTVIKIPPNESMREVYFNYSIKKAHVNTFPMFYPSDETLYAFDSKKKFMQQIPGIQNTTTLNDVERKYVLFYLSCDDSDEKQLLDAFRQDGFIYLKQGLSYPIIFPNPKADFIRLNIDKTELDDLVCP